MIPCSNELICESANWRNFMKGLSGLDCESFVSLPRSEDDAMIEVVLAGRTMCSRGSA